MAGNDRARVIFHGAIVLLVGFLCGLPTLVDALSGGLLHAWRTAHLFLIATGIWLLAMAAVLPSLVLGRRETSALVCALVATSYGFMISLLVQALTGVRGVAPEGPSANLVAFAGNIVGVLGAVLGALLTLMGAHAAIKKIPIATR
jgi:hypothetical protein